MKLAICTPIGPGHERVFEEAGHSVVGAWNTHHGPFTVVDHLIVPDPDGGLGRGKARNMLLALAIKEKADWIFWLDADDLLHPGALGAFGRALEAAPGLDAVWGTIMESVAGKAASVRPGQSYPETLAELVEADPFRSLQVGYFVRTEVQVEHPWREDLDAGEDFSMYLSLWRARKCAKVKEPFFINRRGMAAHGPRGATGGQWRREVLAMLELEKARIARVASG